MFDKQSDVEDENKNLHEAKFELAYRLGIAEGINAALEALSELKKDFTVDEELAIKLREARDHPIPPM